MNYILKANMKITLFGSWDVTGYPVLDNGRKWTFWQYSNRGRLRGFEGEEKYIDLNVFNGTFEEFTCFCTL